MNNYSDKEFHTLSMAIVKALKPMEAPLKIKHARSAIIVTYRTKESKTFWLLCTRQPLMEYRFTAWKFCHLLHKMLREAHESILKQSLPHRKMLLEMGKLWGHLQDGVGHCIKAYSKLLVTKITFHEKNPIFPGSLLIPNFETIENYAQRDINVHYELCVEIFDYLDDILVLQGMIFTSVNMDRMSSMSPQGQCRLGPLITLIQDSNPLYDICVRLMFRLHEALPNDILAGHRERFKDQFRKLKTFYDNVRPLQYFADLIQVPYLPETAPNFSSKVDFGNYVAPVVHVPEEPEHLQTVNDLVDTSNQQRQQEQNENLDRSSPLPAETQRSLEILTLEESLREKDNRIFDLQSDLIATQVNVQMLENQYKQKLSELRLENVDLSNNISTLQEEMANMRLAKDELELKLSQTPTLLQKASEGEEKAKQSEEKFNKLKSLYTAIRDEHVQLLRKHNEISKALTKEQNTKLDLQQRFEEAEKKLNMLTEKCALVEAQTEQMKYLDQQKQQLEKENEQLKISVDQLHSTKDKDFQEMDKEIRKLKATIYDFTQVQQEKELLQKQLSETQVNLERTTSQQEETKASLESQLLQKTKELLSVKHELVEAKALLQQKEKEIQDVSEAASKDKRDFEESLKAKDDLLAEKSTEINLLKETCQVESSKILADLNKSQNDLLQYKTYFEAKQDDYQKLETTSSKAMEESQQLLKQTSLKLESCQQSLSSEIEKYSQLQDKHSSLEKFLESTQQEKNSLQENFEKLQKDSREALDKASKDYKNLEKTLSDLLQCLINRAADIYSTASNQDSKAFSQALHIAKDLQSSLDQLQMNYISSNNNQMDLSSLADSVMNIVYQFTVLQEQGSCIAHSAADIEQSEQLLSKLQYLGRLLQSHHRNLNPQNPSSASSHATLQSSIDEIKFCLISINDILPLLLKTLNTQMDIGDMVQKELNEMDQAIEEAVARFVDLLSATRSQDQGIKLEVNEKILDACTQLMECIKMLIKKSKVLQDEIVSAGRGKSSVKEFYKRNSNWTEGLISASKSVAKGANLLVDAANKAVSSSDPHEQFGIIVAAQTIAACTAQLVIASKVKAPKESTKLSDLTQASREVSKATGAVVATVKSCSEHLEQAFDFDITKLNASQLKAMEMEINVKILELEQALQMERRKLSTFRRQNYQSTED